MACIFFMFYFFLDGSSLLWWPRVVGWSGVADLDARWRLSFVVICAKIKKQTTRKERISVPVVPVRSYRSVSYRIASHLPGCDPDSDLKYTTREDVERRKE